MPGSSTEYSHPHDVSDVSAAFGDIGNGVMPPMNVIPEDFVNESSPAARKWHRFQMDWFFSGLPKEKTPAVKNGIDAAKAWNHLRAIQGSFRPKHEHKQAAVAWLASLWLEDYKP